MRRKLSAKLAGFSALFILTALVAVPVLRDAFASPIPPSPPITGASLHYSTRGKGAVTVDGPGCCDGMVFPSTFEMDYETDTSGAVLITRLDSALADMDLRFHFLIFETARVQVRCGTVRSGSVIDANIDAFGNLTIAPGVATLSGNAFHTRNSAGECGGGLSSLTLTNNAPMSGVLDPTGNRMTLTGSFTTTTEGNTYNISLEMTGQYANRPPVAVFGVEGAGLEAFAQGGCPAVLNGGNPPEYVVEANDESGLKMFLRSFSHDPDGSWTGADVGLDQWFHGMDTEPQKFIGEGRRVGPQMFAFGPVHHLTLETTDRLGVVNRSRCDFRVADRTPPAVTPPGAATVEATVDGGTTPSTSNALSAFLGNATAADSVDSAPKTLPPLLNGNEVTGSTVFPITQEWMIVTFRFADRFGNVGTAVSYVRVIPKK